MAQKTENRLVRTGVRSASGRFALRVGRDLRVLQVVDRGMTLAAHVFTSILPILIVVGALRATLDPQADAIFAEHLGFSNATAEMLDKSLPTGARELRLLGVVGVVVLVIAATSFARALERSLQTIWRTPKVSIRFAWRWLVVIVAVVIGIALTVAEGSSCAQCFSSEGSRMVVPVYLARWNCPQGTAKRDGDVRLESACATGVRSESRAHILPTSVHHRSGGTVIALPPDAADSFGGQSRAPRFRGTDTD